MLLLKEAINSKEPDSAAQSQSVNFQVPHPEELGAIYALERIHGFGPVKFRLLVEVGITPENALEDPDSLPFPGATGARIKNGIHSLSKADIARCTSRAYQHLDKVHSLDAHILMIGDPSYPQQVYRNNPVPLLYVRGDPAILQSTETTAVVGSRYIREPYASQTTLLAATLAEIGRVHVSGFALGADTLGHETTIDFGGKTVCVMPCGVDRLFPPENRDLWEHLLQHPGTVFVSEFGFGQGASSLRLRKRNKLIVALAQEVFVAQSALNGGAMNAYRFSCEQRKPVSTFLSDQTPETEGNAFIESDHENTNRGGIVFDLDEKVSHYIKCSKRVSSWT